MNPLDEKILPVLAGVAGGISGAMMMVRANLVSGWREFISVALGGMLFATFVVPGLCEMAHVSSPRLLTAMGYLGGAVGNLVMLALVVYVNNHKNGAIVMILRRVFHPPDDDELERK